VLVLVVSYMMSFPRVATGSCDFMTDHEQVGVVMQ
jgi:hypothetical protein